MVQAWDHHCCQEPEGLRAHAEIAEYGGGNCVHDKDEDEGPEEKGQVFALSLRVVKGFVIKRAQDTVLVIAQVYRFIGMIKTIGLDPELYVIL